MAASTQKHVFVVRCKDADEHVLFSPTAVECDVRDDFLQLFQRASKLSRVDISSDTILSVNVKSSLSGPGIKIGNPNMGVQFSIDIASRYVDYTVTSNRLPSACSSNMSASTNAFAVLLSSQKNFVLPDKLDDKKKLTAVQVLYNDLIDWGESIGCAWSKDTLSSGKMVFKKLTAALWYIDSAHEKFNASSCHIPDTFEKFQGYNKYKELRRKTPSITISRLDEIVQDLTSILCLPSMLASRNATLHKHVEQLSEALVKYKNRMDKDNKAHNDFYHERKDVNEGESSCTYIQPVKMTDLQEPYLKLNENLNSVNDYEYIDLENFTPGNRYERRKFLKQLRLSKPAMLYRVAYGGSIGTLNFIWSVPAGETVDRTERNLETIKQISDKLPRFSSRAMRKEFLDKFVNYVKCPKSVLRHMFHELSGLEVAAESLSQQVIDDRVAEKLLGSDDPDLLLDLRATNGSETYFDTFFEEMGKYFDELLLQVQERRQSCELYMPMAISLEALKKEIITRVPDGTPVPSTETIRLQFYPANPFHKTALKYTHKFDIKFRVQTRQSRVFHQDAHYVAKYFQYMKEFCVLHREDSVFVCMDDKAIVPVGEPGIPISTGVRGHNKVLAPNDGPVLVCVDHDFHLGGLVPSVALVTEIPTNAKDSFYSGQIFVTTKDKVFQPSTPFRHATEFLGILRANYSSNCVDLDNPVLCLLTDGGPDHRLTYETVKASLLILFMHLDLDMLVALRTAPSHSWTNPAERCMSILNLALQHTALDRGEMERKFENMVKNKSSLSAVRNQASLHPDLKEAFRRSMDSVIVKVNKRFQKMSLKDKSIIVYTGASDQDIEDTFELIKVGLASDEADVTPSSKSKSLKDWKQFQAFIETHAESSHYCFQVKKCRDADCRYCTINPIRDDRLYESLHFLPEPAPDASGEHFLPFSEVYGKALTRDKFRPSARKTDDFSAEEEESDKKNRDIFKVEKLRDAIKCAECNRPRCVFSPKKTDRQQEEVIKTMRESNVYVCGDDFEVGTNLFMRRCLNCTSDVETCYYSAKCRHYLIPVCCYCGKEDELLDDNNTYISELYTKFSVVRPLCRSCHVSGKEAKTWGTKFIKKMKK